MYPLSLDAGACQGSLSPLWSMPPTNGSASCRERSSLRPDAQAKSRHPGGGDSRPPLRPHLDAEGGPRAGGYLQVVLDAHR